MGHRGSRRIPNARMIVQRTSHNSHTCPRTSANQTFPRANSQRLHRAHPFTFNSLRLVHSPKLVNINTIMRNLPPTSNRAIRFQITRSLPTHNILQSPIPPFHSSIKTIKIFFLRNFQSSHSLQRPTIFQNRPQFLRSQNRPRRRRLLQLPNPS